MQWNEKIVTLNNSSGWEGGRGWLSAAFLRDTLLSPAWQAAIPALRKPWDWRLTIHRKFFLEGKLSNHLCLFTKGTQRRWGTLKCPLWTGELSQLGADHSLSLPSSKHSRTISSSFSWSQDSWSSFLQANPCSRDGIAEGAQGGCSSLSQPEVRTEPVQPLPSFLSLSYFMMRKRGSFYLKFILLHLPQEWASDQGKAQKSL